MKNLRIFLILVSALLFAAGTSAQERQITVATSGGDLDSHDVRFIESIEFIKYMNAVENVKVKLDTRTSIITWDPVEGATSYEVYHSTDGKEFKILGTTETCTYTHEWAPKGKNYYGVKAVGEYVPNEITVSDDVVTVSGDKVDSGLYLGLVSFANSTSEFTIRKLNTSTANTFTTFINSLAADKTATALYYGVDRGIDLIQQGDLPDDLINLSIITFTDGLDNWSMNLDYRFSTEEEYVEALKNRIRKEHYSGMNLTAYAIGLLGKDINKSATSPQYQLFKKQLSNLSSDDVNAYEAENMTDVNKIFQEIASKLVATNNLQTIQAVIPGQSDGTLVRFTFDNPSDAANSACYIEGKYNYLNHSLDDVKYKGMTMPEGSVTEGQIVNDIFVRFIFTGIQTATDSGINAKNIKQWAFAPGSTGWQINSEFTPDDDSTVDVQKKSAAVVLVLDCTSSLGTADFKELQSDAISFINTLISQ